MISSIDIFGNETTYAYDSLGRLIKTTYPAISTPKGTINPTFECTYNAQDQVSTVKDPLGYVTRIRYTSRGTPTRIDYPDDTYEVFQYNLDGSLCYVRNRNVLKLGSSETT